MYRTKQQVDKHVSNILGRIRDEKERLSRGYLIAKMYYEIKEYEIAKRYLYGFLSIKETVAEAHKLMGQLQEVTGVIDWAITAYRRSLELDDKQKDVVLKICDLYCRTDVHPDRARFWAEKAESIAPNHEVVFKLRERIISSGTDTDKNTKELEGLISTELLKRPRDVNLRIKLLKLFIDQERINEAYEHAMAVERTAAYSTSLEWYQCLIEVLEVYQEEIGSNIDNSFHRHMLHALNNLVTLTLKVKAVGESTEALHKFDQHLQLATSIRSKSAEWEPFLMEMKAQLFYHAGTLLLKKPLKDRFDWGTATSHAAACYLVSYSVEAPDPKSPWFVSASSDEQKLFRQWCNAGAFRLSQVGHMLLTLCRGDNLMRWMNLVKQESCTQQGREAIFETLFTLRHMKLAKRTSFFMLSPVFTEPNLRFPSNKLLREYDSVAHRVQPDCLSTLVWIAMQYYTGKEVTQPNYNFKIFESLQYNCATPDTTSAESLCVLDTEAFLYAAVWTATVKNTERLERIPLVDHQPLLLPLTLCEPLCSKTQGEWWTTAYRLYTNTAKENLGKMRLVLQRGLEVIRMLNNNGIDVGLAVHLAQNFEERSTELKLKASGNENYALEVDHLHSRARLYWTKAVEMLDRMNRNLPVRYPKDRMFPGPETGLDKNETRDNLRNGKFFLACDLMKAEKHEEAIEAFEDLNMPYASYYQAHVYTKLADIEFDGKSGCELTGDVRTKCSALLNKAKESYYVTMDRIRADKHHKLHQMLPGEIDEIENRILALEEYDEPDPTSRSMSMMNGTDSRIQNGGLIVHSTPRPAVKSFNLERSVAASPESLRHIQPSPERLEAQIRSMQSTQEKVMKDMIECNKSLLETNRVLASELKENRVAMQHMKARLDEMCHNRSGVPQYPPGTVSLAYYPPDYLAYQQGAHYLPQTYSPFEAAARLPHGYPLPQQGQPIPTVPVTVEQNTAAEDEEDYEDGYEVEDECYSAENTQTDQFQVKDSDLIQEWPYGNITNIEGKSTVAYTPRPMPGPGFFSQRPQVPPQFPQGFPGPRPGQTFPAPPPAAVSGASITMGTSNAGQFMTRTPVTGPPPNAVLGTPIGSRPGFPPPNSNFQYPVPVLGAGTQLDAGAQLGGQTTVPNLDSMIAAKTGPPMFAPTMTGVDVKAPNIGGAVDASTPVADEKIASATAEGEAETSYEEPHFEPIVPLPEEVETKTGEEEEKVLYQHDRARLYRFTDQQWKERGTGPVKILRNEKTGKVRFLMRREQILKICANHYILPGMTISPMSTSKNAYIWFAIDFADEESKNEQFCLKFKTEEMAAAFRDKFSEAIKLVEEDEESEKSGATTPVLKSPAGKAKPESETPKSQEQGFKFGATSKDATEAKTGFGVGAGGFKFGASTPVAMFGQKTEQGSEHSASSLLSVMAAKHKEGQADSSADSKTVVGGFAFTAPPKLKSEESRPIAQAGKPKSESPVAKTETPVNPFAGFSFGSLSAKANTPTSSVQSTSFSSLVLGTSTPKAEQKSTSSTPIFGSGGSLSFGDLSKQAKSTPAFGEKSEGKAFKDVGQKLFQKELEKVKSPEKGKKSPDKADRSTDESHPEGYEPTGDYKPVIPLPQLVDVQTGEEEEEKMFGERAKLFRYDTELKQWKERGLGEMKILKSRASRKSRVLMRREQVLKICANHCIASEHKLVKMNASGNAWCWTANDFSEEEFKLEQFAVKFKTAELAEKFKQVFEDCQGELKALENEDAPEDLTVKAETKEPVKGFKFGAGFKGFKFGPAESPKPESEKKPATSAKIETDPDLLAKFKPAEGSWSCDACLLGNGPEQTKCAACETPKPGTAVENKSMFRIGSFDAGSGFQFGSGSSEFQFGAKPAEKPKPESSEASASKSMTAEDIAAKFQVAEGSWKCDACLLQNAPEQTKCAACETPNPSAALPPKAAGSVKFDPSSAGGFTIPGSGSFTYGSPASQPAKETVSSTSGFPFGTKPAEPAKDSGAGGFTFGAKAAADSVSSSTGGMFQFCKKPDPTPAAEETVKGAPPLDNAALVEKFKLKEGEWDCEVCMVANEPGADKCAACATPKPGSAVSSTTPAFSTSGASSFTFTGQSGSGFVFGAAPKPADKSEVGSTTPAASETKGAFQFGSVKPEGEPEPSGFNFGSAAQSTSGISFSTPKAISELKSESTLNTSLSEFKFGETKTFAFTGVTPTKPASSKSGVKSPKSPTTPKSPDDRYHDDDDDSHIHFEPMIPLPEKVEVKTGEEEEETMFTHRAKLYRWVNREWKERGLGTIKILRHKESNRARVLMRREQILKICCNHNITPELDLTPMELADGKAYIWHAMDFAEGEAQHEQLCIRFKTAETASEFKRIFDESKDLTKTPTKKSETEKDSETDKDANTSSTSNFSFKVDDESIKDAKMPEGFSFNSPSQSNFSFGDRFTKSPAGGASPLNRSQQKSQPDDDEDDVQITFELHATPEQIAKAEKYQLPKHFYLYEQKPDCPGCRGCIEDYDKTHREDTDSDVEVLSERKASPQDQERAKKYQLPANFYLYEQKPDCPGCAGCESCETSKTEKEPSKASKIPKAERVVEPDSTTNDDSIPFCTVGAGAISFADVAATTSGFGFGNKDDSFSWTGAGRTLFGNQSKSADDTGGDDDEVLQADDVHYDAVIPLPDLVEVKTGEEDEEPIYSHRAKVYRFDPDAKQWKERGVGDMKILKHKTKVQFRLLMRREQVYKLVCNHMLSATMDLNPMATSETAWCWFAVDYSENKPSNEQLAVRFKTIELAQQFKEMFLDCQRQLREAPAEETQEENEEGEKNLASDPDEDYDDEEDKRKSILAELLTNGEQGLLGAEAVQGEAAESEGEVEQEEEEEDDEDDEDFEEVMFDKRATLFVKELGKWKSVGLGDLQVLYDDEVYGARIQMTTDDGDIICSHHIAIETELNVTEKQRCGEWAATDFTTGDPSRRVFKAQFSSVPAVKEFQQIFKQGVEFAQAAGISEHDLLTIPTEIDVPEVVGQVILDEGAQQEENVEQGARGRAPLAVSGDTGSHVTSEIKSCSPELSAAVQELVRSIQQGASESSGMSNSEEALQKGLSMSTGCSLDWDNYSPGFKYDYQVQLVPDLLEPVLLGKNHQNKRDGYYTPEEYSSSESCYESDPGSSFKSICSTVYFSFQGSDSGLGCPTDLQSTLKKLEQLEAKKPKVSKDSKCLRPAGVKPPCWQKQGFSCVDYENIEFYKNLQLWKKADDGQTMSFSDTDIGHVPKWKIRSRETLSSQYQNSSASLVELELVDWWNTWVVEDSSHKRSSEHEVHPRRQSLSDTSVNYYNKVPVPSSSRAKESQGQKPTVFRVSQIPDVSPQSSFMKWLENVDDSNYEITKRISSCSDVAGVKALRKVESSSNSNPSVHSDTEVNKLLAQASVSDSTLSQKTYGTFTILQDEATSLLTRPVCPSSSLRDQVELERTKELSKSSSAELQENFSDSALSQKTNGTFTIPQDEATSLLTGPVCPSSSLRDQVELERTKELSKSSSAELQENFSDSALSQKTYDTFTIPQDEATSLLTRPVCPSSSLRDQVELERTKELSKSSSAELRENFSSFTQSSSECTEFDQSRVTEELKQVSRQEKDKTLGSSSHERTHQKSLPDASEGKYRKLKPYLSERKALLKSDSCQGKSQQSHPETSEGTCRKSRQDPSEGKSRRLYPGTSEGIYQRSPLDAGRQKAEKLYTETTEERSPQLSSDKTERASQKSAHSTSNDDDPDLTQIAGSLVRIAMRTATEQHTTETEKATKKVMKPVSSDGTFSEDNSEPSSKPEQGLEAANFEGKTSEEKISYVATDMTECIVKVASYKVSEKPIVKENWEEKVQEPVSSEQAVEPVSSERAVEPVSSEPAVEPVSSEPAVEPVSSKRAVEPVSSEQAVEPVSSKRAVEPVSSEPAVEPVSSERAVEPVSSERAVEPVSSEPAVEPVSSERAVEPVSTERAVEPVSSERAVEPVSSERAVEPVSSEPAVEPVSSERAVEPVSSERAVEPVSSERAVEPVSSERAVEPVSTEPAVEPVSSEPAVEPVSTEPAVEPVSSERAVEPVSSEPAVEPVSTEQVMEPASSLQVLEPTFSQQVEEKSSSPEQNAAILWQGEKEKTTKEAMGSEEDQRFRDPRDMTTASDSMLPKLEEFSQTVISKNELEHIFSYSNLLSRNAIKAGTKSAVDILSYADHMTGQILMTALSERFWQKSKTGCMCLQSAEKGTGSSPGLKPQVLGIEAFADDLAKEVFSSAFGKLNTERQRTSVKGEGNEEQAPGDFDWDFDIVDTDSVSSEPKLHSSDIECEASEIQESSKQYDSCAESSTCSFEYETSCDNDLTNSEEEGTISSGESVSEHKLPGGQQQGFQGLKGDYKLTKDAKAAIADILEQTSEGSLSMSSSSQDEELGNMSRSGSSGSERETVPSLPMVTENALEPSSSSTSSAPAIAENGAMNGVLTLNDVSELKSDQSCTTCSTCSSGTCSCTSASSLPVAEDGVLSKRTSSGTKSDGSSMTCSCSCSDETCSCTSSGSTYSSSELTWSSDTSVNSTSLRIGQADQQGPRSSRSHPSFEDQKPQELQTTSSDLSSNGSSHRLKSLQTESESTTSSEASSNGQLDYASEHGAKDLRSSHDILEHKYQLLVSEVQESGQNLLEADEEGGKSLLKLDSESASAESSDSSGMGHSDSNYDHGEQHSVLNPDIFEHKYLPLSEAEDSGQSLLELREGDLIKFTTSESESSEAEDSGQSLLEPREGDLIKFTSEESTTDSVVGFGRSSSSSTSYSSKDSASQTFVPRICESPLSSLWREVLECAQAEASVRDKHGDSMTSKEGTSVGVTKAEMGCAASEEGKEPSGIGMRSDVGSSKSISESSEGSRLEVSKATPLRSPSSESCEVQSSELATRSEMGGSSKPTSESKPTSASSPVDEMQGSSEEKVFIECESEEKRQFLASLQAYRFDEMPRLESLTSVSQEEGSKDKRSYLDQLQQVRTLSFTWNKKCLQAMLKSSSGVDHGAVDEHVEDQELAVSGVGGECLDELVSPEPADESVPSKPVVEPEASQTFEDLGVIGQEVGNIRECSPLSLTTSDGHDADVPSSAETIEENEPQLENAEDLSSRTKGSAELTSKGSAELASKGSAELTPKGSSELTPKGSSELTSKGSSEFTSVSLTETSTWGSRPTLPEGITTDRKLSSTSTDSFPWSECGSFSDSSLDDNMKTAVRKCVQELEESDYEEEETCHLERPHRSPVAARRHQRSSDGRTGDVMNLDEESPGSLVPTERVIMPDVQQLAQIFNVTPPSDLLALEGWLDESESDSSLEDEILTEIRKCCQEMLEEESKVGEMDDMYLGPDANLDAANLPSSRLDQKFQSAVIQTSSTESYPALEMIKSRQSWELRNLNNEEISSDSAISECSQSNLEEEKIQIRPAAELELTDLQVAPENANSDDAGSLSRCSGETKSDLNRRKPTRISEELVGADDLEKSPGISENEFEGNQSFEQTTHFKEQQGKEKRLPVERMKVENGTQSFRQIEQKEHHSVDTSTKSDQVLAEVDDLELQKFKSEVIQTSSTESYPALEMIKSRRSWELRNLNDEEISSDSTISECIQSNLKEEKIKIRPGRPKLRNIPFSVESSKDCDNQSNLKEEKIQIRPGRPKLRNIPFSVESSKDCNKKAEENLPKKPQVVRPQLKNMVPKVFQVVEQLAESPDLGNWDVVSGQTQTFDPNQVNLFVMHETSSQKSGAEGERQKENKFDMVLQNEERMSTLIHFFNRDT